MKNSDVMKLHGVNKNKKRSENDFYKTPSSATEELLDRENFEGIIWEPACGDGAISQVLEKRGYDVLSTDLVDRGYGQGHIDFLQDGLFREFEPKDNIITNPPFKLGLEFVLQAKKLAKKKIAFLLKTTFLESKKRHKMFQDTEFPLKKLYQFSGRVNTHKPGEKDSGALIALAWFIWEKNYSGSPKIKWILRN